MKQVKIEIRDEVNCKLVGLELGERRAFVKKFEYEIPGARYLPSVRLGRWNGKVSYFQLGGSTYINLLEDIIPLLDSAGYDIELADLRDYSTSFQFVSIDENSFSHKLWPKGHPAENQPIVLRDYQVAIVNEFLQHPQSIQVAPTGSGKTIVTAALSASVEQYGRSIVIVPNKSLVTQTETDYKNLSLDVGVFFGDRKELGKKHTICTWQSILSLMKNSKNNQGSYTIDDFLANVVCVICDECFDENTPILTPSGQKPIKDLKPGDKVINYSEQSKSFKTDIVVKVHENLLKSETEKMYELTFDDGSILKVTGNHKFLTNLGWCRADELTFDHEIISYS